MRGGRIGNPLERTLMAASALLGFAVVLWFALIIVSWMSKCPGRGYEPTGLDKWISAWPPGAQCDDFVYEAVPSLQWLILGLAVSAVAILIVGLAASINSLRSRPRPGWV